MKDNKTMRQRGRAPALARGGLAVAAFTSIILMFCSESCRAAGSSSSSTTPSRGRGLPSFLRPGGGRDLEVGDPADHVEQAGAPSSSAEKHQEDARTAQVDKKQHHDRRRSVSPSKMELAKEKVFKYFHDHQFLNRDVGRTTGMYYDQIYRFVYHRDQVVLQLIASREPETFKGYSYNVDTVEYTDFDIAIMSDDQVHHDLLPGWLHLTPVVGQHEDPSWEQRNHYYDLEDVKASAEKEKPLIITLIHGPSTTDVFRRTYPSAGDTIRTHPKDVESGRGRPEWVRYEKRYGAETKLRDEGKLKYPELRQEVALKIYPDGRMEKMSVQKLLRENEMKIMASNDQDSGPPAGDGVEQVFVMVPTDSAKKEAKEIMKIMEMGHKENKPRSRHGPSLIYPKP
ncbi:unnamed protein product [Amoebophrya sp. A120]|nr:unnamed protein product [Amoebophrya sp. A120]|eukprot:GSA120T00004498001.1